MKTDEEAETWYEEERKKALERLLAALEGKGKREEAEQRYKKDLNTLFEKYKRRKLEIISAETKKAVGGAVRKTKGKRKTIFSRLSERLAALIPERLAKLLRRQKE